MSVIGLILILCFLGAVGWLVNVKGAGMPSIIRWLINLVLIVTAIILVLVAFGVWGEVKSIQVPKI